MISTFSTNGSKVLSNWLQDGCKVTCWHNKAYYTYDANGTKIVDHILRYEKNSREVSPSRCRSRQTKPSSTPTLRNETHLSSQWLKCREYQADQQCVRARFWIQWSLVWVFPSKSYRMQARNTAYGQGLDVAKKELFVCEFVRRLLLLRAFSVTHLILVVFPGLLSG